MSQIIIVLRIHFVLNNQLTIHFIEQFHKN